MTASYMKGVIAPLDLQTLLDRLPASSRVPLAGLEVLDRVDSTNLRLLQGPAIRPGRFRVCLAEEQTAGRGRHGRAWISPPGVSLYLSIGTVLEPSRGFSSLLPLALGVGVAETLKGFGAQGIRLKWPNDIYAEGGKLGGILVESRVGGADRGIVVAGLGLNLCWQQEQGAGIGQPWTDLSRITPGGLPERNALASAMVHSLWGALADAGHYDVQDLLRRYAAFDLLSGRTVVVQAHDGRHAGDAQGIGPDGALRVRIDGRIRDFASTDVSVRLSP